MAAVRKRPRKHGSPAWVAYYCDAHGRRHARAFDTKTAADDFEARMRVEARQKRRTRVDPEIAVEDYAERWLALTGPTLRETTLGDYCQRVRLHITPELGSLKVHELDRRLREKSER